MDNLRHPPAPPARPADGHKGTFGRVLIVGGGDAILGAPVLAATAAYRIGAGYVQIAVPQAILAAALSVRPEAIGLALAGDETDLHTIDGVMEKTDVLAVGPGLGTQEAAKALLGHLLQSGKPMVLDADALNLLAKHTSLKPPVSAVLTPHPGEMGRLIAGEAPTDDPGRIELARTFAGKHAGVLVLKGQHTVVSDGQRVYVNPTGTSALAKAGSGDVLTGAIAGLLAQGMSPFDAACLGVWTHGMAGHVAAETWTDRGVLAMNVADALPLALGKWNTDADERT